ncbi:hypothetical protein pdam_00012610, partial [Pocillopora damicornis]
MARAFLLGLCVFFAAFAFGRGLKGAMEQILEANMNPEGKGRPPCLKWSSKFIFHQSPLHQDLLAKWWSPTLTAIVVFTYLEIVTQQIGLKSTCDSKNLENTCNPNPHHSPPGKHLPYYQGDIRLTKKQQENLKKYGDPSKSSADSRAASSVDSERWPNAIIPYTFDCSIGNMESAVRSVKNAIKQWERKTCLRFVPRTNEKAYLEFFKDQGCWGHVGHHGYKTQISIGISLT